MKQLTSKELEYVADSMSNEDLLIKQCALTATIASNQVIRQVCADLEQTHLEHYNALMNALQQHQGMAPSQMQQ